MTPIPDSDIPKDLLDKREELIESLKHVLLEQHPRDDHREVAELCVLVLGGALSTDRRIRRPGAMHQARWMAKAIYCLKMYLFRQQVLLTAKEKTGLLRMVLFVSFIYAKAWFRAPMSTSAPAHDLRFIISLNSYPDRELAKETSKVFGRHLWYLGQILVGLAFFDEALSIDVKTKMIDALQEDSEPNQEEKAKVDITAALAEKSVADFVTVSTLTFFSILGVDTSFLKVPPQDWSQDPAYKVAKKSAQSLTVINDSAERAVALMQVYNLSLAKDEDQHSFILQVVEEHRRRFPDARKSTVVSLS